ncbi:Defective in cullin neddylation protein [Zea mays]|uniref:Defective in cullin neddylation protein n=1 Tax=Zea mays TaxID=4577 RepID=A0A1D6QSE4_MAIZE|nr:Defective in cullin neddylation protein [Zea mays]
MLWAKAPRSTAAYDEIHRRGTCCDKQGCFTLDERRTGLNFQVTRPSSFQDFYIYAFRYCLTEDKKKCIEIPAACELLNLVLGLQFRPQVDKLNNYLMIAGMAVGFNLVFEHDNLITAICFASVVVNLLPYTLSRLVKCSDGMYKHLALPNHVESDPTTTNLRVLNVMKSDVWEIVAGHGVLNVVGK